LKEKLLFEYADLSEIAEKEKSLSLELIAIEGERFERTPGSGKLKRVIDLREGAK
jgi:hypothetical protein